MSLRAVLPIAPIAGDRVTLRQPRDRDRKTIAGYLREPEADAWLSGSGDAHSLLAEYAAGWNVPDEPNRLGLTLIIAGADSDTLVGVVHLEPEDGLLHVGYGVAPKHRRRGIASEALALTSAWALAQGFGRIELEIGEDNEASQGVARRCGFTPTNRIRSQVLPDGEEWHARAWCLEPGRD